MELDDSTTAEPAKDISPTVTGKELDEKNTWGKSIDSPAKSIDSPGKLDQPEQNKASLIMQEPEPENTAINTQEDTPPDDAVSKQKEMDMHWKWFAKGIFDLQNKVRKDPRFFITHLKKQVRRFQGLKLYSHTKEEVEKLQK